MQRLIPSVQDMLEQLIASPSVSSASSHWDQSNAPVVHLLADWLQRLDFKVETLPVPGVPGKFNLIATLGEGPGGLVLSGHTDTVPYDQHRWQSDPFKLTARGDRWYGLGTCDMKGFFPLAIEAALSVRGQRLREPLIILATADEESAMSGARALVEAGRPKARYAVIGEPTELRPIRMHKGIMMERLVMQGRSGHSSDPALGRNALEGMHAALGSLLEYRQQLQDRHRNDAFRVAVPTLNLGHVHGGDNPNRICADCELHFDLRPLPGMNLDDLRDAMRDRIMPIARERELGCTLEPLFAGVPAFEQGAESTLVRLCEQMTGHQAEAVAFATEAPFLQQLGMETLVMGPGSIDQAHQPDEFIALSQLQPTIDVLTRLIAHCCLAQTSTPTPTGEAP
ncbi:MAG: acetylornithine deacetylase [Halomonadaceae bacterium]|nr:MAG: acetylornithine deacetylase [Halomonadaceae bacterium]